MSSNRKSGAQAPSSYVTLAVDLKPTKDEAPAVGAAQGFKNQNTEEQANSPREPSPEQVLRKLQYEEGRRSIRKYLTRFRAGKVDLEDELTGLVSSMQGYALKIFCRFLEDALDQGRYWEVEATFLRSQIAPQQKRFGDLAVRFAQAGCALLPKEAHSCQISYQVMCMGRVIETLPSLDAAERFLQLNTMGGDHGDT
jgi:hypothetical protein